MTQDRASSLTLGIGTWTFLALTLAACSGEKSGERGGGSGNTTGGSTSATGGTTSAMGGSTSATGGSGGAGALTPYPCVPKAPDTPEMTKSITSDGKWGGMGFQGGTFTYGDGPDADTKTDVTMTFDGAALNLKGGVATYTGFGLWFAPAPGQMYTCIDASAYTGVSFNVVDNSTTTATLVFSIQAHGDSPVDVANTRGGCVYSDPSKKYSDCVYPSTTVTVPAGGGVVEVPFTAFMAGKPEPTVNPAQLDGLQWQFPWMEGATAYEVDITLNDLKFY